jgi:hypothetical protein
VAVRWVRPYTPGRGRWLIIAWELGSLALLDWTTVRLFELAPRPAAALTAGLAALWLVGSWQIICMGVYVSEHGVRARGVIGARTVRWTEIEHVTLDEVVYRIGRLRVPSGTTVVIKCRDGSWINTSLWVQGIDFHARPHAFREVYHGLRERHAAARSAQA